MGGPPPQGPKYPGLVSSHPRAVSHCVPAHLTRFPMVPVQAPQYLTETHMSRLEPLTTQRNPDVTWSPHMPGTCPSLAPPPAHRDARSPGTGSAIPQRDPNVLVRSPQGSNNPEEPRCPGTGPPPPHTDPGRPVWAPNIPHRSRRPGLSPSQSPQVPSRLKVPNPPQFLAPHPRSRPQPRSPLTARARPSDGTEEGSGSSHLRGGVRTHHRPP